MNSSTRSQKSLAVANAAVGRPGNPAVAADYVAAMSGDLALLARRHGLETLGYLLDMARLEGESVSAQDPAAENKG